MLKPGTSRSTMPLSNTIAASAPRSSAAIQSTIEWPPISSSPSQAMRRLTGKLAGGGEQLGGLEQHVELALVVGDAARVEPVVALDELERSRVPELERVGRLHVEVPVKQDRGRSLGVLRCADLADDERALAPRDHLGAAAGARDEVGDPSGRGGNVRLVRRVGADGGNRDQLGELGDERVEGRHLHGGVESSRDAGWPSWPAIPAGRVRNLGSQLRITRSAEAQRDEADTLPSRLRYATSRTLLASANARSFFRLWCSIWRMRSRVTLNVRPTSSSVRGCWPSRP